MVENVVSSNPAGQPIARLGDDAAVTDALLSHHDRRTRAGKIALIVMAAIIIAPLLGSGLAGLFRQPDTGSCRAHESERDCQLRVDYATRYPQSRTGPILLTLVGLVVLGATALVVRVMTGNAAQVSALVTNPARVGWVYGIVQQVQGATMAQPVMLCGLDGTSGRLAVVDQDQAIAYFVRRNPAIIVGYGATQQEAFDALVAGRIADQS